MLRRLACVACLRSQEKGLVSVLISATGPVRPFASVGYVGITAFARSCQGVGWTNDLQEHGTCKGCRHFNAESLERFSEEG